MNSEQTAHGRFSSQAADKLRGGYYTSRELADWLCSWAIRTSTDHILEPSCGDGVFLEAAARCFMVLGANSSAIANQIKGVEILPAEAERARVRLSKTLDLGNLKNIETGDFFDWWRRAETLDFDAVLGNPPFIRYQTFPEPHRSLAMSVMKELGLTPNRLTNIWVPFVAAAAASVSQGGRLALVLPAELLQVTYAAQLRSFLADRFERIDIVACNELFFHNAEQEVILLLADHALASPSVSNTCRIALSETATVEAILTRAPSMMLANAQPKTVCHDQEKWLKYFLSEQEISFMRDLRSSDAITLLATHASVDVGVVTGKNEFFVLNAHQVAERELSGYTTPLVSRSAHLRGAQICKEDWEALSGKGDRVHLLNLAPFRETELSSALEEYIRFGEDTAINQGYKCSIRDPWYVVPSVWVPDGFAFRQIYDFPRMVLNRTQATSTDTIHRMKCKSVIPERVIANTYTWLTAASAEIEGRSYGGGVLELEPTEAERLLMPLTLNGAMPIEECDRLARLGRLSDVLEQNARIVLMHHVGLSRSECHVLRNIWEKMRDRRMTRRRRGVPNDIAAISASS